VTLDHLWAGWRREYVERATGQGAGSEAEQGIAGDGGADSGCVFCAIAASGTPSADNGIVWRDALSCALLNAFPYASGHLLVMPVRHVDDFAGLAPEESSSLWSTTLRAVDAITTAYTPDGINLGANLGRAAGAGIPAHLHLHVLPRWSGDTNFMTTVAGVRVMPESLPDTWRRLREAWATR
jgi:diadenosine tetraphosphate (Ap4A) HIT family hydrolase